MTIPESLIPLVTAIEATQKLLNHFNDQGVIIGGVAVSAVANPRYTGDADAMVLLSVDELPHLLEQAKAEGLLPRIEDVEAFARRNRVVLLKDSHTGVDVDISLGAMPFEVEMVERGQDRQFGSLRLRVPTPEDLIIMKAVAHRPKDMLDIETIITAYPQLDRKRIEFWLKQFAELLETPQVWTDVARLLRKARK